ncbi:MAG: InlB B-repeat-containing protein [Anaeroplasmataceae bacterium]|nr:InlB B-repeat-containing protein [Anaeroplasmataceae bacterium]
MKKFLFLMFSLLCLVAVTSCKRPQTTEPPVQEVQKIVVTFDSKGGSIVKSVEIEKGSKVAKPTDPTREGYTFAGWFTTENCSDGTEFNFDTKLEVATKLYAKWDEEVVIPPKPTAEAVSIEIKKQPDKTEYIEGELFDKTGMVVEVTFDDGSKKEVTDYELMPNGEVALGLEMFCVMYGDLDAYGSITVVAKKLTSVEVNTLPTKTNYKNYETFDPTGLVLKVNYDNGKFDLVNTDQIKWNRDILLNATDSTTVTYKGIEVSVPISVTKVAFYGIPNEKESVYVDAKAVYDQLTPLNGIDGTQINKTSTFGEIQVVASPGRIMQWEGVNLPDAKYNVHAFDHDFNGMLKFGGATSVDGRFIIVTPTEDATLMIYASRPTAGEANFLIYDNYNETTIPDDAKQVIKLDLVTECIIPVYAGESYYITVDANAFIKGMALVYNPTYYEVSEFNIDAANVAKDFAVGQKFNSDGLAAAIKYGDNLTATLNSNQFEVVSPDMTTAGVKKVKVNYQGFFEKEYEVTVHELTGIEVTKLPTKAEYFAGESLEVEGLVVSAVAGNIKYPISDYKISKTKDLAVDDEIKISWNDFEVNLEIVIKENPIKGIRVKTAPTKVSYKSGEEFDPTGLVLEVVYEDSAAALENLDDVKFNKGVFAVGDTVVVASWGIFECEIEVEVVQVDWYEKDDTVYVSATNLLEAFGIAVNDKTPASANIAAGSKADFDVLHLEATNKAFQYERITTEYEYDGHTYTGVFKTGGAFGSASAVDRVMSVTPAKDGVFTFYCTAASGVNLFLLDKSVNPDANDSTTYIAKYDGFTSTSNWVTVTFELEAGKTYYFWFTGQCFIRGMNLSYGKVRTIVEELVLDTTDVKTSFEAEEEFVSENLKVSVRCADGGTYELSANEYTITAPNMNEVGPKIVEVKFGEVTVKTYEIIISAKVEVSELIIDAENVVKDFAVGQEFNSNGLVASLKYEDDSTATLDDDKYVVVKPDMTTAGVKTVVVKYQDIFEKEYEITVHELTGIEVTQLPAKAEYFAGESLEVEGLVVSAVAGEIKYAITDYEISKTEALAVGDEIKISWNDFEATLEIVIKQNPITGIRVKIAPTKTSYGSGEEFDPAGLVLEVLYDGSNPEDLESLDEVTFSKGVLAVGDTAVVASWGIFECSIEISVVQVDWYEKNDTTYIKATDILKAYGQTDESAWTTSGTGNFPKAEATINEFHFNCTGNVFQYQDINTEFADYDSYTYVGCFRTGATQAKRYVSITPTQDGTLTLYAGSAAGNAVYLVKSLTAPTAGDEATYVAVFNDFSGNSNYKTITFEVEADQTYYLWFTNQAYIRGMNLSYKLRTIVEELVLDTEDVKTSFEVGEEFVSENLKVSVRCADGNTYELSADEYEVIAPDMSEAGPKTVEVKFGEITVKTYEIVIA